MKIFTIILLILGIINVVLAIVNTNGSTKTRLLNLFSGLLCLVTYFITLNNSI